MEDCPGDRRCLICRRPKSETSSINSEKRISYANLLQDFLNCFQINVLDSETNDLSTSCQFCPTCEQFLAEWSSTQTQMTQLTRRATQLKATLSALLLSAHEIQKRNHEDVTEIINNRIANSQQVELPLWLQETVDEIRNELRKEYSVRVMLEKISFPPVQKLEPLPLDYGNDDDGETWDHLELGADNCDEDNLPSEDEQCNDETSEPILGIPSVNDSTQYSANIISDAIPLPLVQLLEPVPLESGNDDKIPDHWECTADIQLPVVTKLEPLLGGNGNADEPWDHWEFGADHCGEEHLPSEDPLKDEETTEQILGMSFQTEEQSNCDDFNFQHSVGFGGTSVSVTNKTNRGPRKREKECSAIQVGHNRFKFNGYDVIRNAENQRYYCGVCNLEGVTTISSTLAHIRKRHYTAEDKVKYTTARISDTELLYGGKYKIIKLDEKKYQCVSCGSRRHRLN